VSAYLVLLGGDAPSAPIAWVHSDGARGMVDDAPPPRAARTVLVLPGADGRLVRAALPARSEAQARAGAELLLAGTLAVGEATHVAVGAAQNAEGARLVAAISAKRLRAWLDRCAAFGLDPSEIYLDCALWPAPPGEAVIAAMPNRVVVSAGPSGGFSIEPALAPSLIAHWLIDIDAQRVTLLGGELGPYQDALKRELQQASLPDAVSVLLKAAGAPPPYAPDLRQGDFALEGAQKQPFALWRFAALLLVAAVLLQTGAQAIAGVRDRQAAAAIMARAEADFRAARPEVGRIVNLRAQASALVNAMEQSVRHPLIVTSEPVVRALQRHPLARLDEVRHEGSGRRVRLVLSAPQAEPLEAAIAGIREEGLEVDARTLQPRDGRYVAELIVEAP